MKVHEIALCHHTHILDLVGPFKFKLLIRTLHNRPFIFLADNSCIKYDPPGSTGIITSLCWCKYSERVYVLSIVPSSYTSLIFGFKNRLVKTRNMITSVLVNSLYFKSSNVTKYLNIVLFNNVNIITCMEIVCIYIILGKGYLIP